MSWFSRTISWNTLWHMWPLIRPLRQSTSYQGFISIFGAPARLLSDQGTNFMSSIIDKMWRLLGMKKLQTMPYHPQTNGLVERSHQTIMQMIGMLGEDKKAKWPGHLAEIVHAYNAIQSAMMGYNPHYLMFRCRSRLLVDFYFPTLRGTELPKRHLCQACWQISSHIPVYSRGSETETVLWLENRCCRIEAWQSCLSQGRFLSREKEG